jgi:hypothetical protein
VIRREGGSRRRGLGALAIDKMALKIDIGAEVIETSRASSRDHAPTWRTDELVFLVQAVAVPVPRERGCPLGPPTDIARVQEAEMTVPDMIC